ncbi:sulfatase-like hydrolase/transferase [Halomicrobium mukohataei]|uniref:Sulfatase-like hydrolase/transferase n=1 Tax=Halomicrobium mukohataei TaxID=57705 RepID=A0A847UBW9_9EURY|nr:sulfatase [Halomicrobium mukohataei]NLV08381.1 sulfatase-like hydrolase/transferase [Halomicrobium mukohataei]
MKCVLYVSDSLRYKNLGINGYDKDITPSIDAVGEDGITFSNVYAQGTWTIPSSASVFTGLYPESHGANQFEQPLSTNIPHIAKALDNVKTACFSTNPIVSSERNYDQGFDEFFDLGDALEPDVMDTVNDALLPWVEKNSDESFFVLVWGMGTHQPYKTPADIANNESTNEEREWKAPTLTGLERSKIDTVESRYNDVISYTDEKFGEFVELLKKEEIYDETSLIFTSDHGNMFDEHARLEHSPAWIREPLRRILPKSFKTNYGLFDRSAWIGHLGIYPYDELLHVPLVFKPAESTDIEPRYTDQYDGNVELIDLAPTIADIFDVDAHSLMQGTSLYRYLTDREAGKSYLYSSSQIADGNIIFKSVQNEDQKLFSLDMIAPSTADLTSLRIIQSLVDYTLNNRRLLVSYPDEETRIKDPSRLRDLTERQQEHVEACERVNEQIENEDMKLSTETMDQLEELGYIN